MMCSMILLTALLGQTDTRQMMEEMNAENGVQTWHDTRSMMRDMNRDIVRQAQVNARRAQQFQPPPPVVNPARNDKAHARVAKPPATSKPALTKAQREAQIQKNLAKNRDAAKQAKPPETKGAK